MCAIDEPIRSMEPGIVMLPMSLTGVEMNDGMLCMLKATMAMAM